MSSLRQHIASSPLPLLETHMLLQQVLGVSRAWLITHDAEIISVDHAAQFNDLLARRVAGEPMAYLLGSKEFFGYEFKVTPDVLVPRPETEHLVEYGLDKIRSLSTPKVLDLGTGSGAVAISIALQRPDAVVQATDISAAALAVAKMNAHELGAKVRFHQGSWYDTRLDSELMINSFDLIVSNPPYVGKNDAHLAQGDLRFEPDIALTDFADGLSAIHSIIKGAPMYLVPDGFLCIEHGWDQAAAVRDIFNQYKFTAVASLRDLANIERLTFGQYMA